MSFEGFDQVLCKAGHLSEFNCWDTVELFDNTDRCTCGEPYVWRHVVDQTNGYDESSEWTSRKKLETVTQSEYTTCNLGHRHCTKEATYVIPEEKSGCSGYKRPKGVMGGPCLNCGRSQPEHTK